MTLGGGLGSVLGIARVEGFQNLRVLHLGEHLVEFGSCHGGALDGDMVRCRRVTIAA